MNAMREVMDDAMHPSREILVSQDGPSFEIVHDGERVIRLYADGRKNKGSTGVERKTKWEEDKLVTEMRLSGGFGPEVKITETWALALPAGVEAKPTLAEGVAEPEATSRLAITTKLEGGMFEKPVLLKRIYEREPAP